MRKSVRHAIAGFGLLISLTAFSAQESDTYSLTVKAFDLRNTEGIVQFALYDKDGSLPDEEFKNCIKVLRGKVTSGSSEVVFSNLSKGKYAVNVLHDENINGKIDKGLFLPKEGVGFSNYTAIGLGNKPRFAKASFDLQTDLKIEVKVLYF